MSTPVRLLVLSDLHLEFAAFKPPDSALFDIVVLAGDIAVGVKAVHWARRDSTFAGKPVVLVPGNHEFYGSERTRMLELLRAQAAGSNVHLLDRDDVILNGVRFLGATLWTDFELDLAGGTSVEQAMRDATRGLNDFGGSIRERVLHPPGKRRFTPDNALREHRLSRAWLTLRRSATLTKAGSSGGAQMVSRNTPPRPATRSPAMLTTRPCKLRWASSEPKRLSWSDSESVSWLPWMNQTSVAPVIGASSICRGRRAWMSPSSTMASGACRWTIRMTKSKSPWGSPKNMSLGRAGRASPTLSVASTEIG